MPHLILRVLQLFFTLVCTALIGNVIATAFAGNPAVINYAIFTCVFAWLAIFFGLAAAIVESLAIPVALWVADGFATLFTFVAGVALAAKLGVHSCGNSGYVESNYLTNGSFNMSKRCHELQAATAFFWFLFLAFAASLVMTFLGGGSSTSGRRGGGPVTIRGLGMGKGGPAMSHV